MSWDHRTDLTLPSPLSAKGGFSKTYDLGGEDAHLIDHNVDGRIIMPVGPDIPSWMALQLFLCYT